MAKKKAKAKKVTRETMRDVILKTIAENGESLLSVSSRAGIGDTLLSAFVNGSRGISFKTAEKICEALGLRLVKDESSSADSTGGADK